MKKMIICLLIACMGFAVAACSQSDTKEKEGSGSVVKKDITVMVYDRNNIPTGEGTLEKNRWTEWIRENGPEDINVQFIPVPRGAVRDKLNALFASGSAPDLILDFDPSIRNELVSQQLVMPLDELIENESTYYKGLIESYPALARLSTKEDGKNYMFGIITGLRTNHITLIRNDWLKKLELQAPTSPEELLAVAKAFSEQDPDGNKQNDTYGIAMSGTSDNIFSYAFQTIYPVLDANKQYVNPWEQMRDSYDFRKQLFEANVVDQDFLTDTSGKKAEKDFVSGKIGIWNGNFTLDMLDALKKAVPDAEVIPISLPRTKYGQFAPELGNPMSPIGLVNKKAKHPDAVMKYIDFITNPETAHTLYWGIEGVHWEKGDNGLPRIIDEEKYKQEVAWNRDYGMMTQVYLDKSRDAKKEDMNELEKEYDNIMETAKKLYLNEQSPLPYTVDLNTVPTLPQDLLVIKQNAESAIKDIWVKSIVKSDYSAEKAMEDAQNIWNKSGGKKVDEYIAKWFEDNKDNIVFTSEYYNFK